MATNNNKNTELKQEQVLLTEAEFERKQRLKNREKINRVTRVFGLFAILLLVYAGVFDPFFELSYFGALADKELFHAAWGQLRVSTIYDDSMLFGNWLGQMGITIVLIGVVLLTIYFVTYTIVDLIDLVKSFASTGKDITRDLSGNVRDTIGIEERKQTKKKKPVKKSLFLETMFKTEEEAAKKGKKTEEKKDRPRRTENGDYDLNSFTSDQLDDILSGKPLDIILGEDESGKNLFTDSDKE
jgi:hypothetical protein